MSLRRLVARNRPQASERPRLQERIEATRAGRAAITAFVVAALAGLLTTVLPEGALGPRASSVALPYLRATGLDNRWTMFAPDPPRLVIDVEARLRDADGRVSTWRPPYGGPALAAYRDYRWRKLMEMAVWWGPEVATDSWRERLWHSIALYAAGEKRRQGRRPVAVTLVRRSARLLPPDSRLPARAAAAEREFFKLVLDRPRGGSPSGR